MDSAQAQTQANQIAIAAAKGNFSLVRQLHEAGYVWDQQVCEYAAQNGHLDILKYAYENGCPFHFDLCVYKNIIMADHLATFKYITEHGIHYSLSDWFIRKFQKGKQCAITLPTV